MNIATTHAHLLESAAPARLTIPELWNRARTFLASMFAAHGAPQSHLQRPPTSAERNAIIKWLKPAERLARGLLIVSAITRLLMTEQDVRQRATAKPIIPPAPPIPPPPPKRPFFVDTGIDLGATIARHYRREPPPPPPRAQPVIDPNDPATWRAPFRVLHWLDTGAARSPPPRAASPSSAPQSHLRLIRRIEALRRVLEDPTRRTRTLAAYIARLPKGYLGAEPSNVRHRGKPVVHLRSDLFILDEHVDTAIEAINSS